MAVLDANRVLSGSDTAEDTWKKLKDENPQILSDFKQVFFSKTKSAVVFESQGWEQIETLFFNPGTRSRLLPG
jgi:hypothetical protein